MFHKDTADNRGAAVLRGLQGKQLYAGTVPAAEVERRRTKNRAARRARRLNRGNR